MPSVILINAILIDGSAVSTNAPSWPQTFIDISEASLIKVSIILVAKCFN